VIDVARLMAKARTTCESARALLDRGDADGACNRANYAMLDAARAALLATKAETTVNVGRTHSGVLKAFSLHLVKTAQCRVKLVVCSTISADDAQLLVEAAETFVATLAALVAPDQIAADASPE
jgi:uncharacterized protein (UPF0332 family)